MLNGPTQGVNQRSFCLKTDFLEAFALKKTKRNV